MSDRDAKTDQKAVEADEKKPSPSAGMFGFAGPTRFHPGRMPERRDSGAVRFGSDSQDDTGGHSRPE